MPTARPSVRRGRIVFAWIADKNGHGKLRPAAIVTSDIDIQSDNKIVVVAITTSFPDPPPIFCVPLPWHPRGHPITRLHQRSAAVTNWLASIFSDDIVGFGGDVPSKVMPLIDEKLSDL